MVVLTVAGQVTDGGVAQASLSVALINIDERTTGATGRATTMTDGSGNYSVGLSGASDDQLIVVVQNTDKTKFGSAKFWATSATSYTKDLTLTARREFTLREPPGLKIKVTAL